MLNTILMKSISQLIFPHCNPSPLVYSIEGPGVFTKLLSCSAFENRPMSGEVGRGAREQSPANISVHQYHYLVLSPYEFLWSSYLGLQHQFSFSCLDWPLSSQIAGWFLRPRLNRRASYMAEAREHGLTACTSNLAQREAVGSTQEFWFVFSLQI